MARKYMSKDVTTTTIKCGKIQISKEGKPEILELPDITEIGTLTETRINKLVNKQYGFGVSIYNVIEETKTYRMKVEEFMKVAELVTEEEYELLDDEEEEEEPEEQPKRGRIKVIPKEETANT